MQKAALLSVSDREGLVELAKGLVDLGYKLLSTGGTGRHLKEHAIPFLSVEEYTGQKEILDGRVKTLHPRIHAGLLARRDDPAHMQQLEQDGIMSIDVVVTNLYPFSAQLERNLPLDEMIEYIDVGGTALMRAASKNFKFVYILTSPAQYAQALDHLRQSEANPAGAMGFRHCLAASAFQTLAADNLEVASYLSAGEGELPGIKGWVLQKLFTPRYGENPHQQAALYARPGQTCAWKQLSGKELSYNNLLDVDAALSLLRSFGTGQPFAAILKHLNPCGAARGDDLLSAFRKAKHGDPRSHFGGILVFNGQVDMALTAAIREDFAEVVLAPAYAPDALEELKRNKNLRIMLVDLKLAPRSQDMRTVEGGILVQQSDQMLSSATQARLVTSRQPSSREYDDLEMAWRLCRHVKSNAVVLVREGMLVGCGAGQMSRVDSVELAVARARMHGNETSGSVAASDAFFPFPDGVENLAGAGVNCIIAPSGAKRDDDVMQAAEKAGVSLLWTGDRHFWH